MITVEENIKNVNELNKLTNEIVGKMSVFLTDYIGQKVRLRVGGFCRNFRDGLNAISDSSFFCQGDSMCVIVSNGKDWPMRKENRVFLCEIENQLLTKLYTFTPYKSDYTVDEFVEAKEKVRVLESELNKYKRIVDALKI